MCINGKRGDLLKAVCLYGCRWLSFSVAQLAAQTVRPQYILVLFAVAGDTKPRHVSLHCGIQSIEYPLN